MIAACRPHSLRSDSPSFAAHRQRAGHAIRREMLHQAEEPRQVGGIDALFVEREDEVALRRAEREIAVLDALRDAAEGDQMADVIVGKERGERVVGNLGIDGHGGRSCAPVAAP